MRATRSAWPPTRPRRGPTVPYLSRPGDAGGRAQLEHPRLAEDGRADACSARIVDEDRHVAGELDCPRDLLGGQRLVRHGQPCDDQQVRPVERRTKFAQVLELAAGEGDRAPNGRVAVAGREADNPAAGRDQHLHGRDDARRRPVREEDVVTAGHAAEVLEAELGQTLAVQRRRELVVERPAQLRERHRADEAGEVVERSVGVAPGDDPPRRPELRNVVGGRAQQFPARIRQLGGDGRHTSRFSR